MTTAQCGTGTTGRLTTRQRHVLDGLDAGDILYWPTVNRKGLRGIWLGPPLWHIKSLGRIDLDLDVNVHARTAQALLHLEFITLLTRGHFSCPVCGVAGESIVNRYIITKAGRAALR